MKLAAYQDGVIVEMTDSGDLTVVDKERDPEDQQRRLLRLSDGTTAGPFLVLSLSQRNITVGSVFTESVLQELVRTDALAAARELSIRYLAGRSRTEAEVKQYLTRHSYHASLADEVVQWLKEQNLLDDGKLSERYVEQTISSGASRSRRDLAQRLLARGVASDQVKQVMRGSQYDETGGAWRDGQRKLAEIDRKLSRGSETLSDKERNRKRWELLAGYLYRKGYAGDTVRLTLRKLLQSEDS